MRCEELRERFAEEPRSVELTRHLEGCPDCRLDWQIFQELQALQAPPLNAAAFDRTVLDGLERRGAFSPRPPSFGERLIAWFARALPPVAVAACLLLLLWLGNLAATRPGSDVRALTPDKARVWSRLPDAVPPALETGPAPPGAGLRVGKESHEQDS